jgi:hypothetical protein
VRRAEVVPLAGATEIAPGVEATEDEVRFDQAGLRVLVRHGAEVIVDWDDGADETMLEALLYGMAARQLLLQRGTFTLHASLVVLDGRGIAIGGHSGAGKSTTALALAREHGARLAVDDVLPVAMEGGQAVAEPFDRPVHLTDHAAAQAGIDLSAGSRVGQGEVAKLAMPLARAEGPVPLHLLVVLDRTDDPAGSPVQVSELRGAERLRRVVRLSNVSGLASLGRRSEAFFAWSTGLAAVVPTIEVTRPEGVDTLDEVAGLVADRAADRR